MRALLPTLLLVTTVPAAARAGDVGGPSAPMVDLGVEQRTNRTSDGSWDWGLDGSAVLPVLDVASTLQLSLRLTEAGRLSQASTHWGFWQAELSRAEVLTWNGRLERGLDDQLSITLAGGIRLDRLGERLGLARTPLLQVGLRASTAGADAATRTRWSSTLVLALDLDLASAEATRHGKVSSGFRIRASAALGNDPGCGLGTPTVLFSGRCLSLALALEY